MSIKVVMLTPNFGFGGAEKVFADHSKLLKESGVNVVECVFNDTDSARVYSSDVPYVSLKVYSGNNHFSKFLNFILRIIRFYKFVQEFKPSIIISHLEGADYVNLLCPYKCKKIVVVHGSKMNDNNIKGGIGFLRHKVLIPFIYKLADKLITVNSGISRELQINYGLSDYKIFSLPNFFDIKKIEESALLNIDGIFPPLFQNSSFKLITFARLSKEKNIAILFPVLTKLKQLNIDAKLYIIGDGDLRLELLEQASSCFKVWDIWEGGDSLDSDIFFLGYQSNPHKFLKYCDLYVMSSLTEGFPMALCEAMASGISVISSDCSVGVKELLTSNNEPEPVYGISDFGAFMPILNNSHDTKVFSFWIEVIISLVNSPILNRRLAESAKSRIDNFDKSILGLKWIDAYIN